MRKYLCLVLVLLCCSPRAWGEDPVPWPVLAQATDTNPLPGTESLDWQGDLAAKMVAGVDKFLLREIEASRDRRSSHWKRDFSSPEAYTKSVEPNRRRLAENLGVTRDTRPERASFEYADSIPGPRAETKDFTIRQVRWRAFGDVHGVGLLLEPRGKAVANVIAIPDAGQKPEELAMPESEQTSAYAFQLARLGCRVLVPELIERTDNKYRMSSREYLHRSAFILGRTFAGYETQKILAAVDCFKSMSDNSQPVAVVGWGEGGRLALYSAALDTRIDGACVIGYFAPREKVWNEPADRTVFRLLRQFGDAEIASLIVPRSLIVEDSTYPSYVYRPDENGEPEFLDQYGSLTGKPGKLIVPTHEQAEAEFSRLKNLVADLQPAARLSFVQPKGTLNVSTLLNLLAKLGVEPQVSAKALETDLKLTIAKDSNLAARLAQRQADQIAEIDRHNQLELVDSPRIRMEKFASLKTDSLEAYQESIEPLRKEFRDEVIGKFDQPLLPPNVRSRKYQEGPKTISYEVVLDVFPDVFAYGILTVPKSIDLASGPRRPVVVCQHGLEGRPQDVVSEKDFQYYKAFATRLAERGFVTFSPQNIYIGYDRFRTLQFKAMSLGCTLYSIMVPQHQQITNWLGELPFVDPERIAFYGLSYGGKSAMRIPALVDNYCLSICAGDFDDWVWKNAATDLRSLRYSYANKGEYEMFEFNLGGTFNYAEMAALICPRPFMIERGHFDGVAPDEAVAYEYAKVRHLYQAKLGIGDCTEIEWFVGPHAINGVGTFAFLSKHLDWPLEIDK